MDAIRHVTPWEVRVMRLTGVGKRYGPRGAWVLRAVDLDLSAGALVRVDGSNGSGKSTLLKIVAGVCAPTTGRVDGRATTAYVPDRFPPGLPFTMSRYLTHLGRVHGLSGRESARRGDAWIERFDVAAYASRSLRELSKGTCQKVAVIQALIAEPALLVLDEAWTGLDAGSRQVLDEAVADRVRAGGVVVFADHDAARLGDATTGAYRIEDGGLRAVPTTLDPAPTVLIDIAHADARLWADLPADLVGDRDAGEAPTRAWRTGPGRLRVRTDARHSDALLRHVLTAHPTAHVVRVSSTDDPDPDPASGEPTDEECQE